MTRALNYPWEIRKEPRELITAPPARNWWNPGQGAAGLAALSALPSGTFPEVFGERVMALQEDGI